MAGEREKNLKAKAKELYHCRIDEGGGKHFVKNAPLFDETRLINISTVFEIFNFFYLSRRNK